jgi:hypothetical protein
LVAASVEMLQAALALQLQAAHFQHNNKII